MSWALSIAINHSGSAKGIVAKGKFPQIEVAYRHFQQPRQLLSQINQLAKNRLAERIFNVLALEKYQSGKQPDHYDGRLHATSTTGAGGRETYQHQFKSPHWKVAGFLTILQ
jgi:hypothetical protein